MKIKCYDSYNKQHIIVDFGDDRIEIDSSSSNYASANLYVSFVIDTEYYKKHPDEYAEDPDPMRWSDLTDFEII